MKVLITAVGTRGDVAPYTGLARRMVELGHEVRVLAYAAFADMVEAAGAELAPLPGDPFDEQSWVQSQQRKVSGPLALPRLFKETAAEALATVPHMRAAAADRDVVLLAVISSTLGHHVAESVGVPGIGVYLQPMTPTREHPPATIGVGGSLGAAGNRLSARVFGGAVGLAYRSTVRECRDQLGLPPLSGRELRRRRDRWPVLHAYSPVVLPRPADWPPEQQVTGYLWPAEDPGWEPPAELTAFLDDGPPPVVVGFGSRVLGSPEDLAGLAGLIEDALDRAGVRGLVQSGWSGLATRSSRHLTIGEVPHSWLFPRVAAVVHHAGAGTTAAGLRFGCPTVVVPVIGDQPFWATRVSALGVGPAPIPYRELTAARLGEAIRAAVTEPGYRERARSVARTLRAEDGAGAVIARTRELVGAAATGVPPRST